MGITNYVYRLKPKAGDTTPVNEVGGSQALSGGTFALVDLGSGVYAWRFTGALSQAIINSKTLGVTGSTPGGGVTIAIRYSISTYPGADTRLLSYGAVSSDLNAAGLQLRSGGTNLQYPAFREAASTTLISSAYATLGTVMRTVVIRLATNVASGTNEEVSMWHSAGGATTAPDDSGGTLLGSLGSNYVLQYLMLNPAGSTMDVRDLLVWHEELNNADCDALRDNIDTALSDTTPPTLSSPTATATGSTTASGSVSTNEAGGTLYKYASINSSETAATVKASGTTTTVTASGSQTGLSFSGLSPSTTYYAHYVHRDAAGNDSTVASSASFTTSAGADVTPPTMSGSITVGTVTSSSIQISWPAGSDNIAVTSYEVSSNNGSSYTDTGSTSLTYTFTGLTASTSYQLAVRSKDAAGNVSPLALFVTQSTSAPVVGTLSIGPLKNNTGTLLASLSGITVYVYTTSGTLVVTKTAQTSNGSALMSVSDASLSAATQYRCVIVLGTGAEGLVKVTAT